MSPLIDYPLLEVFARLRSIAARNSGIRLENTEHYPKTIARDIPKKIAAQSH
jgi:hypothetical protein